MNRISISSVLVDAITSWITLGTYFDSLEPIFASLAPVPLTTVLSASHCFCSDCCDLYTPCHVSEWIEKNGELYDSEIDAFRFLLDSFSRYIAVDVEPYDDAYRFEFRHVATTDYGERMRQIYTVIVSQE